VTLQAGTAALTALESKSGAPPKVPINLKSNRNNCGACEQAENKMKWIKFKLF